jgi:hypothetical protein
MGEATQPIPGLFPACCNGRYWSDNPPAAELYKRNHVDGTKKEPQLQSFKPSLLFTILINLCLDGRQN